MNHSRAPILEALAEYHRSGQLPFTPPGHKQGRGADPRVRAVLGDAVFHSDVLAVSGLDDRTSSQGILQQAEELMADAVGADHAFFSTCGSSLSVKSAMLAVAGPHEHLVVGRDAHKSVVSGLILSGVRPLWVDPAWDAERHLAHPPTVDSYEKVLAAHPEAKGAMVVSPTPYGTSTDLRALAEACHRRDLPLLVDEAWGAHLPFHPDLPTWAMDAGADLCVTSVHKMGAGLEQGSVYHQKGDLVAATTLRQRADLFDTTSPSVLMYAALDGWRRQMVEDGHRLLSHAIDLARDLRERIARLEGLHVVQDELVAVEASHDLDPLQILIDVSALNINGYQAADWLREHHCIDVGLSDHRRILATMSTADDRGTAQRLLDALRALTAAAPAMPAAKKVELPSPGQFDIEPVISPREAFFGPTETIATEKAIGRICAEQITPYPPGIPALVPGERISRAIVDYLRSGLAAGMVLPDPADPTLDTVRVTAD